MKAALSIALYLQEVTTLFTITPKKKKRQVPAFSPLLQSSWITYQ